MKTLFNPANLTDGSSKSVTDSNTKFKSNLTQQIRIAIQSLAKDLNQSNSSNGDRFRDRLVEIVNLTKAIEQQEETSQQQISLITEKLRQASNRETLFNLTVTEITQLLEVERVLIYIFESETQGIVAAEALQTGFTPTRDEKIASVCFGLGNANHYQQVKVVVIEDIEQEELSPYQKQLMERFQVRASLAVPILLGSKVWGLLVTQQCGQTRQWQEVEIRLLEQVSRELVLHLQVAEVREKLQKELKSQKALARVIEKLRQPFDIETLYRIAVKEVRKLLEVEHIVIYQFDEDYSRGNFIAEAEITGFPKLVGSGWEDSYLHEHRGGRFRNDRYASFVCNDIHQGGLSECHIDTLESFGIKSFAIVGLYKHNQLWGLLAAYQNTGARTWSEVEIELLHRVSTQISIALEQNETLEQIKARNSELESLAKQEQALNKVVDKIRQTLNLETIFQTATQEVRKLLNIERVTIYKFDEEYFGEFVGEAELPGYPKFLGQRWDDPYLNEHRGGMFRDDEALVCDDVYNAGLSDCHIEALENYGVKSCAVVSIFKGDKLWGLLSAFQNTGPRHWSESEISLLRRVAAQIGIALSQAEILTQVQNKNAQLAKINELEKAGAKIVARIRQNLDFTNTLNTTTKELRLLLSCDRVVVYRFNEDWSGSFIAESVSRGWDSLIDRQDTITILKDNVSNCRGIQSMNQELSHFSEDTWLKENEGGKFRDRQLIVRDDIYQAGFTPCYLEVLEEYQARAYAIAPVFIGTKLWGLLAAFQNSDPRHWEAGEVNLLNRVANQFGVALQQLEYVEQLQQKSRQIFQLAEQGVAFAKLIYQLGQQSPAQLQDDSSVNALLRLAVAETRRLFKTDRVAVYQFNPDWSGEYVVEDVGNEWIPLVGTSLQKWEDTYLQENQGGRYARNETLRVDNIYTQQYHDCHLEILEQFGAKAYMLAPIFNGEKLWGLLSVYHNQEPRTWDDNELRLLTQVASQIGVVIQRKADLHELSLQREKLLTAAEREKSDRERLQREALSLLRAVEPALEGDLTVKAPLWEDEVGTIADGYNTTLQTLRELVRQVKSSAAKVDTTCHSSTGAISELSNQARQQSQDLERALQQLQQMVESIERVTLHSHQVDQSVTVANQTIKAGDTVMQETVLGIAEIRETVSETAKKVKNLGESSQKIAKVVSLIDRFANQTNLLAINAAIEATRAGEYGKGFAVVADEIRTLAYQSANATNEIERLVAEIRTETQSVTEAMELGIMQVVKGTELVNKTRQSLDEIKLATKEISDRVEQINASTTSQTSQSQLVTKAMTDVAEVADRTSANSVKIASLFDELLATSEQLQNSISKFKID